MRTSKYRGKDVKTGEWKYGHLINFNVNDKTAYLIITDDYAVVDKKLKPWEIAFFLNVDIFMVDPNTAGQFTGLTDKNGNEIYEDDIIHLKWEEDYDNDFGVVKWHSNGYFYVDDCFGKFPKGDRRSLGSFFETICRDYKKIEISINGNIHDNPELIRKKSLNH